MVASDSTGHVEVVAATAVLELGPCRWPWACQWRWWPRRYYTGPGAQRLSPYPLNDEWDRIFGSFLSSQIDRDFLPFLGVALRWRNLSKISLFRGELFCPKKILAFTDALRFGEVIVQITYSRRDNFVQKLSRCLRWSLFPFLGSDCDAYLPRWCDLTAGIDITSSLG